MPLLKGLYSAEDVNGVRVEEGVTLVSLREPQGAASLLCFTMPAAAKLLGGLAVAVRARVEAALPDSSDVCTTEGHAEVLAAVHAHLDEERGRLISDAAACLETEAPNDARAFRIASHNVDTAMNALELALDALKEGKA